MIALLLATLAFQDAVPAEPSAAELDAWRAATAYSEERGGLSLLVRRGGKVVFEQYVEGHGPDKPYMIASGSVGFWALAALAAEQDRLLDLDGRVSDTIEEWRGVAGKEAITVRQLLQLESGLAANDPRVRDSKTIDHYQAALQAAMVALPGEVSRFGPTPWYVFGALLERKLVDRGEDALDYLKRRLLDPLGLEVYYWDRDRSGKLVVPHGAYLTAREWSKLGQLLLDGGRVGDEQLLEAERLERDLEPSRLRPSWAMGFWRFEGLDGVQEDDGRAGGAGDPQPDRVEDRADALPRDVLFSAGFGKQRLYVLPSEGLVVVRQGIPAGSWSDVDFLRLLLGIDDPPGPERAERDG